MKFDWLILILLFYAKRCENRVHVPIYICVFFKAFLHTGQTDFNGMSTCLGLWNPIYIYIFV